MFDLRSWLRRTPKPKSLRIRTGDDEERIIEPSKGRFQWHALEETVRSSGAVSVQCLDEKGNIIRACDLDGAEPDEGGAKLTDADKATSRTMRDQAAMLDAYGRRLNEAFDRGSASAGSSQDKLVELVEVLTNHLAIAITNVNNLSVNLSNALQAAAGSGEEGNPNGQLVMGLLAAMSGRAPVMAAEPPKPNGKKG